MGWIIGMGWRFHFRDTSILISLPFYRIQYRFFWDIISKITTEITLLFSGDKACYRLNTHSKWNRGGTEENENCIFQRWLRGRPGIDFEIMYIFKK